jgi:hypothetical protein
VLFRLNGFVLAVIVTVVIVGATAVGVAVGRGVRHSRDRFREPASAVQASLLGFVGLLLAFGLTMAVDRYQHRREAVVGEANAIGTTYLRAETLAEPERSASLRLLQRYADLRIELSHRRVDSDAFDGAEAAAQAVQRDLWAQAGAALTRAPTDSAPRLYVETLNELIDADTTRVAALGNRIPTLVVDLQIGGSALAMGAFGFYIGLLDRGIGTGLLASVLVVLILLVVLDLDRPTRGIVKVPATPLTNARAAMEPEPATGGPIRS